MKDKYEKVILGVVALIAIAMVVLGVMKLRAVEADYSEAEINPDGARLNEKEPYITTMVESLSKPPVLKRVRTAAGREVDTFTGVPYYVRRGKEEGVDLEAPDGAPVHKEIPNSWFLENGLEEEIGYGDAPQRDFDSDGFSNLEEYKAKTNPNDKNSFPSLFAKIKLASIEKDQWYLRFSDFGGGSLSFRIEGTTDFGKRGIKNRMKGGKAIPPGTAFFTEEPYQGRFKFVESFKKEVRNIPKTFARIEDLKPGKGNRVYEIPTGSHRTFENDYTARLFLDTPEQENHIFSVEEGQSFSLPYDKDAAEKPYTLKEIGGDGTTALLLWQDNGDPKELKLQLEN